MKRLKNAIKRSIDGLGYEIHRKKNAGRLKMSSRKLSAGRIFEMVGPSGIGKSTLFTSINDELEKEWFLPHHASDLGLSTLNHDVELVKVHRRLLLQMSTRLDLEGADFWVLAGVLSYGAKVASTDILMRSGLPRGFALDEGVFQVFAEETLELDASNLKRLFAGRILVHLNARDPDTIAERAMCRHEERLRRGHFQHPTTFETQRARADNAMKLYARMAESAQNFGVEVLHLFAEDAISVNRQAILDFAHQFSLGKEIH